MADKLKFVDETISRSKFDAELRGFREKAHDHESRGIFLLEAAYPKAFAVFATPNLRPAHLMFGAELDFTNYDIWPPSIRFADPLTREYWPANMNGPINILVGGRVMPMFVRYRVAPDNPRALIPETPVIFQGAGGVAFLCMRGVREYHDHPAHSGDNWLQYRGTGVGSLYFILDKLHEFGVAHIGGLSLHYLSGPPRTPPAADQAAAPNPNGGK